MDNTFERNVWPLFIEPNPTGHSCYLVAWDPKLNGARNYRLERISAVKVLEDRFGPPLGFSMARYLAHAWGIWTTAQPVDVELSPISENRPLMIGLKPATRVGPSIFY